MMRGSGQKAREPAHMTPSAVAQPPQIAGTGAAGTSAPAGREAPGIVEAAGLGQRVRMYEPPLDRLWEWLGRRSKRGKPLHTDFWAVRGVSFKVKRGECLGII